MSEKPEDKLWRTLICIEYVDEEEGIFWVRIPSWNNECLLCCYNKDYPEDFEISKNKRFHAFVNTFQPNPRLLKFKDIERH